MFSFFFFFNTYILNFSLNILNTLVALGRKTTCYETPNGSFFWWRNEKDRWNNHLTTRETFNLEGKYASYKSNLFYSFKRKVQKLQILYYKNPVPVNRFSPNLMSHKYYNNILEGMLKTFPATKCSFISISLERVQNGGMQYRKIERIR